MQWHLALSEVSIIKYSTVKCCRLDVSTPDTTSTKSPIIRTDMICSEKSCHCLSNGRWVPVILQGHQITSSRHYLKFTFYLWALNWIHLFCRAAMFRPGWTETEKFPFFCLHREFKDSELSWISPRGISSLSNITNLKSYFPTLNISLRGFIYSHYNIVLKWWKCAYNARINVGSVRFCRSVETLHFFRFYF